MERYLCIWIHSKVSNESERILLEYQKDKILNHLEGMYYSVFGRRKEVSTGEDPHSSAVNSIRTHVNRGDIGVVIVADKTRLLVDDSQYQELKLFCEMLDVKVVELHEIDGLFYIDR
ncbi:hypothetical protein [[Eubacterium] hominis]|uniref:hypothetical protein n=1 Tax=[Eubacterium] hominis TaxID=2764325 RepID=UPI003A4D36C7